MRIIAQTIRNNKAASLVPILLGICLLLLLRVKFQFVLLILALISFGFAVGIYFLATKKWKVKLCEESKKVIISDQRNAYEIPLSNVSDIHEYTHFTPKHGRPYTNYAISLYEPLNGQKSISFSIYDHEKELIKNCNHLKALTIIERSKRAKDKIKRPR